MSQGLDTYNISGLLAHAQEFYDKGFRFIGAYYFKSSAFKELLTADAARRLSNRGFYVVSVFESGSPTSAGYFSILAGIRDAATALNRARAAGQPKGTPIYATVDYDASSQDLPRLHAYFKAFRAGIAIGGYTTGVYGSGLVCKSLKTAGLVTKTWLSQSKGFIGYKDWLPNADIVQGQVVNLYGVDCDLDESRPTGGGGWQRL